jgi:hypothetical protein
MDADAAAGDKDHDISIFSVTVCTPKGTAGVTLKTQFEVVTRIGVGVVQHKLVRK